jgi:hypothetical protein
MRRDAGSCRRDGMKELKSGFCGTNFPSPGRHDNPGIDSEEPAVQSDAADTIASVVIFGKALIAGGYAGRPVGVRDHFSSPMELSRAG